jgi:hypothetical protein
MLQQLRERQTTETPPSAANAQMSTSCLHFKLMWIDDYSYFFLRPAAAKGATASQSVIVANIAIG